MAWWHGRIRFSEPDHAEEKASRTARRADRESGNLRTEKIAPLASRALVLPEPPAVVPEFETDVHFPSAKSRNGKADDEILTAGGVLISPENQNKPGRLPPMPGKNSWSLQKQEGRSSADQLVQALRSGDGVALPFEDLIHLLHGRNSYGWEERNRNWIGDEMMTMLRQDMPERAFGELRAVVENDAAPAAMRDYAIQHISHLVNDGMNGADAVAVIRRAYESGDPEVAGTALISLYRISQQQPALMSFSEVRQLAEKAAESAMDDRTKMTAEAILKENR